MASFLYPCTNGCGRQVRFVRPTKEPVVCNSCVEAIAANEASSKKATRKKVKPRTVKRRPSTKRRA